jgi:hypothetical protein
LVLELVADLEQLVPLGSSVQVDVLVLLEGRLQVGDFDLVQGQRLGLLGGGVVRLGLGLVDPDGEGLDGVVLIR